ncbi:hypothetical protein D915_003068 [Fasciola hepatica]|uniref:Uncharacterized protein n=1 Tax=Fasciola hepatica TaxID=6192 RepID=A0A4E0S0P3_FASHE|nr:hypothetical protein D915_003068 [Fasciola hepatica]
MHSRRSGLFWPQSILVQKSGCKPSPTTKTCDEDDAQFRQLIERSSSASENVIEEKIEPVDILGPTVKTNEPNPELKLESVETIPKREESFPVMVSLADVEQQDMIGNAHDNRNDTGDADEDDSLDESFEKVSPEPLID